MEKTIIVHKLDSEGEEVWRYQGELLKVTPSMVTLEARFDREDVSFHGLRLTRGDRFVETFYTDRWYNVFAIYDCVDNRLKGWYCNITRPATIEDGHVYAEDLALDLIVHPDGRWTVLDEEEFRGLTLSPWVRAQALGALHSLQEMAAGLQGPFQRAPKG